MKSWGERSPEIAALLNPAFCSQLIAIGIEAYVEIKNEGAPFELPFIMLPLILHKPTRDLLPRSFKTSFSAWVTHPETAIAKVGFSIRARNMVPYTRESLLFAFHNKKLILTDQALLKIAVRPKKAIPSATPEVNACFRGAILCGKWFSRIGSFKTAMSLIGVRP